MNINDLGKLAFSGEAAKAPSYSTTTPLANSPTTPGLAKAKDPSHAGNPSVPAKTADPKEAQQAMPTTKKEATSCPSGNPKKITVKKVTVVKPKEKVSFAHHSPKSVVTKMAHYIRYLANKIPAPKQAADVSRTVEKTAMLFKLAKTLESTGNIFDAVNTVYKSASPAYRHQVINGLAKGFARKMAMAGMGVSTHGSTQLGNTTAGIGGNPPTVGLQDSMNPINLNG